MARQSPSILVNAPPDLPVNLAKVESKEYAKIPITQQTKVVSFTGNIALVGNEARLHIHAVLALPDGSTIGGHVFQAHAWPTLEVVLVEWQKPAWRNLDEETGIQILIP